jgi:RES domain-containing protein
MSLDDKIKRWTGGVYRQIPEHSPPYNPLDFTFCRISEGRWHERGEPTLYTAKDYAVCIAEHARNMTLVAATAAANSHNRIIYEFSVSIEQVLDLTETTVLESLGRTVEDFKDVAKCRATAKFLRTTKVEAVIVPSMAFPDKLDRWCMMVFLEKYPTGPVFIKNFKEHRRFLLSESPK